MPKALAKIIILVVLMTLVSACGPAANTIPPSATVVSLAPTTMLPTHTVGLPTAAPSPTSTPTPTITTPRVPMATETPRSTLYPEPGMTVDVRTYGGRLTDWGYDILLLGDGGTLIVGQVDNMRPSHRITPGKARLIRTDAEGEVIWQKDYGGDVDSMFYCPIQTGEDEYVILGQIAASYTRDEEDIYLVKIDSEGNEIWSQTYGGRGMDHGKMVRQTSDGGFIIVGDRADEFPRGGLYQSDLVLIKADAEGNEVWTRTYGKKILYLGWGVAQTPDGGYILAGWEAKTIPDRDVIAIKTDEEGQVEWSRSWDLDPGDRDGGFDLILTADGHVVIAGIASMDDGPRRAVLIKVDLEGNEVWAKEYDAGAEGSEFWDIMEDTDGGYVMAGGRYLTPINRATGEAVREGLIVKTAPDGEVVWQYAFNSSEYESTLLSSAVVLPDRGYIFVGAATPSGGEYWDVLWLRLTSDGIPVPPTDATLLPTPTSAPTQAVISADTACQVDLLSVLTAHGGYVTSLAFSGDGSLIASASMDHTIRLWDVASGQVVHTFRIGDACLNNIAFSPDGHLLASSEVIWDVETRQIVHLFEQNHCAAIDFSPDGATLAIANSDGPIMLWDVASWQVVRTLDERNLSHSIEYSPDGTQLAVHREPNAMVKLWDVASGQLLRTFPQIEETYIHSVAFSPDGQFLASAGADGGTTLVWDVATGQVVHTLQGNSCWDVTFSPDGSLLATSGCDSTIMLWDVASGRFMRALNHDGVVMAVVFAPDGTLMASSGYDRQIYLWGVPR